MFNLSTQDVVLSIGKAPLVNLDGIIFQEYQDFFGDGGSGLGLISALDLGPDTRDSIAHAASKLSLVCLRLPFRRDCVRLEH